MGDDAAGPVRFRRYLGLRVRKWKRVETEYGPRFRSTLAPHEAALLKNLVTALIGLLDDRESSAPADELEEITGIKTGNSEPPQDSTLKRLLPDFHKPDEIDDLSADPAETSEMLNAALRNLHEPEIIGAKRDAAQQLLDTIPEDGGRFELTEDDGHAWAGAVNDVRLALGTMLDVGPDGPEQLSDDDPMSGHLEVYHWLTYLQEYLVLSLMDAR